MNQAEQPYISFILVTRNEEKFIRRCVDSVIGQSYPKERYELIVVDGMSTDNTGAIIREILQTVRAMYPAFHMTLLENEKKILSSGWNIGIQNAAGEYVVRIDAHAEASPDFLQKSVAAMLTHDAVAVGGRIITRSLEGDRAVVSKVLSSPFGVGNSSFRVSDKAGYTDTVVYGLYDKKIFNEVGFFDERFVRNQDMEFHSRVKKHGGKFYFDPSIVCTYYARNSFKKMLKQGFQNGKWNMVLLKKNPRGPSLRHLIPFLFVGYLLLSVALGFLWHPIWYLCAGVLALHLLLGCVFAAKKTKKLSEFLQMPFMFMALHLAYGFGFFAGLFK